MDLRSLEYAMKEVRDLSNEKIADGLLNMGIAKMKEAEATMTMSVEGQVNVLILIEAATRLTGEQFEMVENDETCNG